MELQQSFEAVLQRRQSCRQYSQQDVAADALLRVLHAGQGLRSGDTRRVVPSAHALNSLTLFVIARRISDLQAGVYEYVPSRGQLVLTNIEIAAGKLLSVSLAEDIWLEDAPVVIVIAANLRRALEHFHDQQADGMRGRRYVDFEAGSVAQSMALSAAAQGLGGVVVMGVDERLLKQHLALDLDLEPVALYCLGVPADAEPAATG